MTSIVLTCPVCRKMFQLQDGYFACPHSREGEEHILHKIIDGKPHIASRIKDSWDNPAANRPTRSFEVFRTAMGSNDLLGDEAYLSLLGGIDRQMKAFEGKIFQVLPLVESRRLAEALGRKGHISIKDETSNITGSHKGRHLMGTLFYLEALRKLRKEKRKRILTIYSCGNAALAAAAVARAGQYELHAFVPDDVEKTVMDMLAERGAIVEIISRDSTGKGDPCYLAFQRAILEKGWIPFSCSGNDNWSNIEGGETLGWEMILQLKDVLSSLIIQVGGGALARAVSQAWNEFHQLGVVAYLPKVYACQPEGGFPFVRAYYLVLKKIASQNGLRFDLYYDVNADPKTELKKITAFSTKQQSQIEDLIDFVKANFHNDAVQNTLTYLLKHRHEFMWAWDGDPPRSLARGILDDITYDWYYLLLDILRTGGKAEILLEKNIEKAYQLSRDFTDISVSHSGVSGLAGLIQLEETGFINRSENVGLFFTGIDRGSG